MLELPICEELERRAKAKNETLPEYLLDGKLPKRLRSS